MLTRKAGRIAALLVTALFASATQSQIALVMSPGATPLTKAQIVNLYLGRAKDLKLLDLPEDSPAREVFYRKAVERDQAQMKAIWSRIVFTGKGQPPTEVPDSSAVKKAVAAQPNVVGYIDKSAVDASVKVVLFLD